MSLARSYRSAFRGALLLAAGAFSLLAAAAQAHHDALPAERAAQIRQALSRHELRLLDGKRLALRDLKGEVVVVNFWATWCKPCREEMPSMEVLYKNFEKDGLVVLAVSIDRVTTKKDIPPFVKGMSLTFPVLVDSWGQTDKRYKLMGVPETYIIDQEGILREKVIGPRDWTLLDNLKIITGLLKTAPRSAQAAAAPAS